MKPPVLLGLRPQLDRFRFWPSSLQILSWISRSPQRCLEPSVQQKHLHWPVPGFSHVSKLCRTFIDRLCPSEHLRGHQEKWEDPQCYSQSVREELTFWWQDLCCQWSSSIYNLVFLVEDHGENSGSSISDMTSMTWYHLAGWQNSHVSCLIASLRKKRFCTSWNYWLKWKHAKSSVCENKLLHMKICRTHQESFRTPSWLLRPLQHSSRTPHNSSRTPSGLLSKILQESSTTPLPLL